MCLLYLVSTRKIFAPARIQYNADASSYSKVFFILFRETLETSIIVSVLLAFLKQTLGHDSDLTTYKKLKRQVSRRDDRYPTSFTLFSTDIDLGMAWYWSGSCHLPHHRCWPDRSLLRLGQRQVVWH